MSKKPIIVWFRQDLRMEDNPALTHAHESGKPIVPLYIFDQESPNDWKMGGASLWWLHHSLKSLSKDIPLILRKGNPKDILDDLIKQTNADTVYWNRCYEPYAIDRDKTIKANLSENDINVESFNASLLHEPWTIKTQTGSFYKVYTPFSKNCFEKGDPDKIIPTPNNPNFYDGIKGDDLDDLNLLPTIPWDQQFYDEWTPGETGAMNALNNFLDGRVRTYKSDRDKPGIKGTSKLSPHLHFGEISPKQIWHGVRIHEQQHGANDDTTHFLKEVLWREFGYHLLYHIPNMPEKPLNEKFTNFPWNEPDESLNAWQKGLTGYPIIDAGMRELWQTGWMHNRVRMIVGSFLVKNLRIHWRHGEDWFWDTLVDADLANNSAGWQWIAGCGADAAPYFRIFNPILQSKKFDKNGDYIRKYIPELQDLPSKYIHTPWDTPDDILLKANIELGKTYPKPICDLKQTRNEALEAYNTIKG